MKIVVKKDGDGFLAKVTGTVHGLFAYGTTKELALKELRGVLDMVMDIQLEELEQQRQIRNSVDKRLSYAV